MSGTPPEADNEYSRAAGGSRGLLPRRLSAGSPRARRRFTISPSGITTAVTATALLGATVLIVSEFTTLYAIHVVGKSVPAKTVVSGSHHGYALIPVGLLAFALALLVRRGAGRAPAVALAVVGAIALVIALAGDLPDANKRGLVPAGAGYELGTANPSVGFFLETLGAVLLMAAGGVGWVADIGDPEGPAGDPSGVPRSAS